LENQIERTDEWEFLISKAYENSQTLKKIIEISGNIILPGNHTLLVYLLDKTKEFQDVNMDLTELNNNLSKDQ
jgi:hypothetical protein